MLLKYHIPSAPMANRFPKITKSGVIAWEEGCLKCARCVKKECVYKVYEKRDLDERQMLDLWTASAWIVFDVSKVARID